MRLLGVCAAALLATLTAPAAPEEKALVPSKKSSSSSSSSSAAFAPAAAAAAAPIDGKTLTKEKLLALPDGTVVQIKGKTFTAGELRTLAARSASRRRGTDALKAKGKSDAAAVQSAFRAREASRISRANAQLAGQFAGAHRTLVRLDTNVPLAAVAPVITSISGNAEPGAALYIHGKFFGPGTDLGKVLLKGLPGGDRTLDFDPSYLFPWQPTAIAVIVPDITKVVDQAVSIVVVRKDGMSSAPRSIPFTAAREVQSAFPNKVVQCGQDATDNACLAYDFFEGVHTENTFWEVDALGCDHFEATAKPPWEFEKFQISNESSGGQVGNPGAVRSGDLYKWQVCWTVNGAGPYSGNHAKYVGFLMIRGPKGVPSF
jgi:hypothetical protein